MLEQLLLIFCGVIFLILFCAAEAFDRLSGGQILKLREKDVELSSLLGQYLDSSEEIGSGFKLLLFVLSSLISYLAVALLVQICGDGIRPWRLLLIPGTMLICWFIGEILSQLVLYRYDLWILRIILPPMAFFSRTLLSPFTLLTGKLRENAEDWRDEEAPEQKISMEDEILSMVENYGDHDEDDSLEEEEKKMIKGILDLDEKSVREIMTPRVDVKAIPASASVEEAIKMFLATGHSRIPIYGRTVDEIKGILYAKDFLDANRIRGKSLEALSHKPLFIPESKEVADLLEEIRRLHNHFAVIIDEYGGTSGIVTFEDIIEEIVGDVQDEFDNEKEHMKPRFLPDGSLEVEARTSIGTVNEILDSSIPDTEQIDTIGGFICSELGRIPEAGEVFQFEDQPFRAKILKADKRKILLLRISIS